MIAQQKIIYLKLLIIQIYYCIILIVGVNRILPVEMEDDRYGKLVGSGMEV